MKTWSTASDEKVGIMNTLGLQWLLSQYATISLQGASDIIISSLKIFILFSFHDVWAYSHGHLIRSGSVLLLLP